MQFVSVSSPSRKDLRMSYPELGQGDAVQPPLTEQKGDGQNGS